MNRLFFRFALSIASVIAAAIVMGAVIIFMCALGYVALSKVMSDLAAASITVLVALSVVAIILAAGHKVGRLAPSRRSLSGSATEDELASMLGGILGADIGALARAHPHKSVLGSLCAGFALGASPRLREILASFRP